MAAEQPATEPVRIEYDVESVITRLQNRLADIIGPPAAAAEVEAARLEAIVRKLAGDNATLEAQLGEARSKLTQQPAPPAGGAA